MFSHFKHNLFRRYIIAFGALFNNIVVVRDAASGTEVQRITVPLDYAPKERWLVRLLQDPELKKGVAQVLPRLAFEMTAISYDSSRKLNTLDQLSFITTEQRRLARLYVGVPYALGFSLHALVKTQEDGFQITEQILPYFTPDYTFAMQVVDELSLTEPIPLTLNGVTSSDNYEGDFEHRRAIIWTFDFSMKVYFYGPVRRQTPVERVIIDIYNSPLNDLLNPPVHLRLESPNDNYLLTEDGSGHLVDESTANAYLTTGRVARIEATETQTTITEDDGDVKRTDTLTDESL